MDISINQINKIYQGGKKALKDVSIEMKRPDLIGLVGPNGAGKSTLMKLLVAELLPTAGEITVDGEDLLKNEIQMKASLGYLPQTFGLYDELTVYQFLDYMAALKGIKNGKEAIDTVIKETNLEEKRKAKIKTLSGGQRQRVGIAQAFLGNPGLLIFDEPTVGLDPEERINFRNLFSKKAEDKIVILSTHIIEDVQSICNRLIVLHEGRIRYDGTPEQLIVMAQEHVGIMEENKKEKAYHITARINTANGVMCRIVANELPTEAKPAEPTLEDAYMYLITREEVNG
ncbi:MAG: nodI2 [Anaerocolumna sp.]|jgi:ABC-type multidrug transport system ATPase subunit|nr:nodI2 [Anaerocolumna sp.]